MTKSMIIAGVGGQGTLLASKLLGNLFLSQGYDVKPPGGERGADGGPLPGAGPAGGCLAAGAGKEHQARAAGHEPGRL